MRGNVPVTGALLWFSAGSTALVTRSIVAHSCTVEYSSTLTSAVSSQTAHILLTPRYFVNLTVAPARRFFIASHMRHDNMPPLWSISFIPVDLEGLPSIL